MPTKPVPRLPVVGDIVRSKGRLIKVFTPPPIQPPKEYIFEDVSYEIVVMNGEHLIHTVSKLGNLYSDSITRAIEDAKKVAINKRWNIPQSGMRVDLIEIIERTRYVVNQASLGMYGTGEFYDREFVPMAYHKDHSYGLGEPTRRDQSLLLILV